MLGQNRKIICREKLRRHGGEEDKQRDEHENRARPEQQKHSTGRSAGDAVRPCRRLRCSAHDRPPEVEIFAVTPALPATVGLAAAKSLSSEISARENSAEILPWHSTNARSARARVSSISDEVNRMLNPFVASARKI